MKQVRTNKDRMVTLISPKEKGLIKASDGHIYTRVKGALRRVTHKNQDISDGARKIEASFKRQELQNEIEKSVNIQKELDESKSTGPQ